MHYLRFTDFVSLADSSWENLDISGFDGSNFAEGAQGMTFIARGCLGIFKLKLNDAEENSWEELDAAEIGHCAESLRWLYVGMISIYPPQASSFGFRAVEVPRDVFPGIALDDRFVEDVDPQTWAVCGFTLKTLSPSLSNPIELSLVEKFRLAFVERDTSLAPKASQECKAASTACRAGVENDKYRGQGNCSGCKSIQIFTKQELAIIVGNNSCYFEMSTDS